MLVELESAVRPLVRRSVGRSPGWVVAVLLFLLAAAGSGWWWNKQRIAPLSAWLDRPTARPIAIVKAEEAARPYLAAGAMSEVHSTAAHIEAAPEIPPAPAGADDSMAVSKRADDVAAPLQRAGLNRVAKAPSDKHVKVVARTAKKVVTVAVPTKRARKSTPHTAGIVMVPSSDDGAFAATVLEPGAAAAGKDPDIVLLTAVLTHLARDGSVSPLGDETQLTLAQIAQRCEARGGRESSQARTCRRRICEGYWGKAEACPARMAPSKD